MLTRLFPTAPRRVAALALAAAASSAAAEPAVLSGAAAYRERMAPPPDAELVVQLQSLSNGEARMVAESRQALPSVPARFEVPYDTADVDPAGDYGAAAWIESGGRVLWRTPEPHPVLVDGAATGVELQLKRVLSNVVAPAPEETGEDADPAPEAEAEAPAETEAEAAGEIEETGAEVAAAPAGAATARPPAEGESALAATGAGASAAPGAADAVPAELVGTWRAEDIAGKGVVDASGTSISFAEDGRASGLGGCNTFNGDARFGPDGALGFGPLATTFMACAAPALGEQEQRFFAALDRVRAWRIENDLLHLLDADGETVARLWREK